MPTNHELKVPTLMDPFPEGVMPEIPKSSRETFFSKLLLGGTHDSIYFILAIGFMLLTGALLWWQGVTTSQAIEEYFAPTIYIVADGPERELMLLEQFIQDPGLEADTELIESF